MMCDACSISAYSSVWAQFWRGSIEGCGLNRSSIFLNEEFQNLGKVKPTKSCMALIPATERQQVFLNVLNGSREAFLL